MSIPTILSLHVGLPATHGADSISQKPWESGIFKSPVAGRVFLDTLNLAGDGQQDLKNHGGPFRAVLAYSADHYPVWWDELGRDRDSFPHGSFGENFTVDGLDEASVCLGDIYAVGEARIQVSQPRWPCYKLARRNDIKDLPARVDARGWGGWYHRVVQTGHVAAGDAYALVERPYPHFPISLLNALMAEREHDPRASGMLAEMEMLTPSWRQHYAALAEER
jgi:MOSC domain-containing protein YiiM